MPDKTKEPQPAPEEAPPDAPTDTVSQADAMDAAAVVEEYGAMPPAATAEEAPADTTTAEVTPATPEDTPPAPPAEDAPHTPVSVPVTAEVVEETTTTPPPVPVAETNALPLPPSAPITPFDLAVARYAGRPLGRVLEELGRAGADLAYTSTSGERVLIVRDPGDWLRWAESLEDHAFLNAPVSVSAMSDGPWMPDDIEYVATLAASTPLSKVEMLLVVPTEDMPRFMAHAPSAS